MPLNLKEQQRRTALAEVLTGPGTFATTMLVIFHDEYYDPVDPPDKNCYAWHPGTILLEVRDDFGVELPQANFDRLMAGIAILTSDRFYQNEADFVQLCAILAGGLFDPGVVDPVSAAECAWGLTEALFIDPPDDDEPFSAAVRAYVGRTLDAEGILNPPDVLRIGLRGGGDRSARVQADYADDPETLGAVLTTQAQRSDEIKQMVRSGLVRLRAQLEGLQLAYGDTSELATRLAKSLGVSPVLAPGAN